MLSAYDLHTHSRSSDGFFLPADLVRTAAEMGVRTLALTDHDCIDGLREAATAAHDHDIELIPGIELSVTWQDKCLHIVGLNIDPTSPPLLKGIQRLRATRNARAEEMGRCLAKSGIEDAYAAVRALAGDGMITRTHFAQFLVQRGYASSTRDVFARFLTAGKPGYVSTRWATLEEAIEWIRQAQGIAVLAHPVRYRLTGRWMRRLLTDFRDAGGQGIEVISGNTNPADIRTCAESARRFELYGSVGSDFHAPENGAPRLGKMPPLPASIKPVWQLWEDACLRRMPAE
jgi:predicted metal-dependent phosphoesterase TrpH